METRVDAGVEIYNIFLKNKIPVEQQIEILLLSALSILETASGRSTKFCARGLVEMTQELEQEIAEKNKGNHLN